jgi:hypothetical protein
MMADGMVCAQQAIPINRLGGVLVLVGHEPARVIGPDRQDGEADRAMPIAGAAKEGTILQVFVKPAGTGYEAVPLLDLGAQLTPEIAAIRGIPAGQDSISPNRHPDIHGVGELLDFIARVRDITGKPTGFKTVVASFEWLDELMKNRQVRQDQMLSKACQSIQATLNASMAAVTGRLEDFDNSTQNLWENVSAARFRQVEELIRSYHTSIGGVLCALTVKIEAWAKLFPHKNSGGPQKRAEFIMADLRQGIEKIQHIESVSPMRASLR